MLHHAWMAFRKDSPPNGMIRFRRAKWLSGHAPPPVLAFKLPGRLAVLFLKVVDASCYVGSTSRRQKVVPAERDQMLEAFARS
jgi:hypothetical protein